MNYQSKDGRKDGRTWTNVYPPPTIYISIKFDEIRFRGYLVIANYMDFKSIQGL